MADPVQDAYADCIDVACPEPKCLAPPQHYCRNAINGRTKAIGCLARYKAADEAAVQKRFAAAATEIPAIASSPTFRTQLHDHDL
ncbi:hypothetical protein ACIBCN_18665 [Nocardia sp. NPDC051052]|uniref:hypothetical protein n=1 Tax=Nocardia sp. NPDC051052 TaxID=3364322 RepID=UPI003799DD37